MLTDGVVTLRAPVHADAPMFAAAVLSSLDHIGPWMPWATADYSEASAKEWMDNVYDPTGHSFVVLGPDGQMAGSAGVNRVSAVNSSADVGYWLRSEATGQGLATRATILLLQYSHEVMGLHRAEILMSTRNDPSRRVAERAIEAYTGRPAAEFLEGTLRGAMQLEGEFHDTLLFAVLQTDLR